MASMEKKYEVKCWHLFSKFIFLILKGFHIFVHFKLNMLFKNIVCRFCLQIWLKIIIIKFYYWHRFGLKLK